MSIGSILERAIDMAMEKITFDPDGQGLVDFYIIEQTRLGGVDYYLVTDVEEGDGEAFILKDLSEAEAQEAVFEFVEDEDEFEAVAQVFSNLVEDVDLQ